MLLFFAFLWHPPTGFWVSLLTLPSWVGPSLCLGVALIAAVVLREPLVVLYGVVMAIGQPWLVFPVFCLSCLYGIVQALRMRAFGP